MQTDFVAVPPFWTVGQVIDHMREAEDLPETFSDIYVVDPSYHVVGGLDLSRLLRTKRDVPVEEMMDAGRQVVLATADQEAVARQFERYDLKSAPRRRVPTSGWSVSSQWTTWSSDRGGGRRGPRLAAVGDERITTACARCAGRFWWLFVKSLYILCLHGDQQFDATIEHGGHWRC